jgi:hypothetical protein
MVAPLAGMITPTNPRLQLVATVTPYGALAGSGDEIDGVPFQYPISLCNGCVVANLGACPLPAGTVLPEVSPNPCNIYQDGSAVCCKDALGNMICPPTIATALQ